MKHAKTTVALIVTTIVLGVLAGVACWNWHESSQNETTYKARFMRLRFACVLLSSELRVAAGVLEKGPGATNDSQQLFDMTFNPRALTSEVMIETCTSDENPTLQPLSDCRARMDYACYAKIARKVANEILAKNPPADL
jgi:hypothetical protein